MPKRLIYADNAATTDIDEEALQILIDQSHQYYNPSQTYSLGVQQKKKLELSREKIARCINANPNEIFFTSGGSESDNWALKCIVSQRECDEIITSSIEHSAILNTCKALESIGKKIIYIDPTPEGLLDPEILQKAINSRVSIVSIMYTNNETGTIQPIKKLAEIAHANGSLFHTDAVQAVGHIDIDVKDIDVDLLSASAHKFNGPRGVGFLYIKGGTPIRPLIHGGSQQRSYRAGTENTPAIMAMALALEKRCSRIDAETDRLSNLELALITELQMKKIQFELIGSQKHRQPGIISISFPPIPGEVMMHRLDLKGVCISTGSACTSSRTEISHVLTAMGLNEEIAHCTVRISLGSNNTLSDIHEIVDAISEIINSN